MASIASLVYQLSAMSYIPGVDSIRQRAIAEAELIGRFHDLISEVNSLRAERDALIVHITKEDKL